MNSYSGKSIEKIEKYIHSIGSILIICLILFSLFNSLIIGLSWDEHFHYIKGLVGFEYLKTFGNFEKYNFGNYNNMFYPGLYDSISYSIGYIILLLNRDNFMYFFLQADI